MKTKIISGIIGLAALITLSFQQAAAEDAKPKNDAIQGQSRLECKLRDNIRGFAQDNYLRAKKGLDNSKREALRNAYCNGLRGSKMMPSFQNIEETIEYMEQNYPNDPILGIMYHELASVYQWELSFQIFIRPTIGDILFFRPKQDIEKNLRKKEECSRNIFELNEKAIETYKQSAARLSETYKQDKRYKQFLESSLKNIIRLTNNPQEKRDYEKRLEDLR